jgi:hypothetical protein
VANRVELISADGAIRQVDCLVVKGEWWSDDWISSSLELELGPVDEIKAIKLSGYNFDTSAKWIGNELTLAVSGQNKTWSLGWGKGFELGLDLAPPVTGRIKFAFAVSQAKSGDDLDRRLLAVRLSKIALVAVA